MDQQARVAKVVELLVLGDIIPTGGPGLRFRTLPILMRNEAPSISDMHLLCRIIAEPGELGWQEGWCEERVQQITTVPLVMWPDFGQHWLGTVLDSFLPVAASQVIYHPKNLRAIWLGLIQGLVWLRTPAGEEEDEATHREFFHYLVKVLTFVPRSDLLLAPAATTNRRNLDQAFTVKDSKLLELLQAYFLSEERRAMFQEIVVKAGALDGESGFHLSFGADLTEAYFQALSAQERVTLPRDVTLAQQ